MSQLGMFVLRLLRANPPAALFSRSTKAMASAISSTIAIAKAICLTLFVISVAAAGLAQTPAPTDGWVVLPVNEYTALRHAAFPLEAEPGAPPVEATLSRIDYDLKVDGDLASGEARLTVDVIKDGWVRLALPSGLMVREAKLDGRQVTLLTRPAGKGPGDADLLLSKTGRSILTLKIVAPVSTVAGTDILQLPTSNSAVSHATVELTRQGVDVHITGGLLLEHSELTSGSRWVANGQGAEALTFAWRRKVDDQRATQPLRLRGAVTQLVGLGEDTTQLNAEVYVEILQGLASEIHVLLPEGFTVNQVSGAMVADWDNSARELTVSFIEPVQNTVRFTVSGELRLPRSGQFDVPLLRLPAAERETGGVAIEVLGAGEIKERQANGLEERLQPAEGKSLRTLSLKVARYTPQAVLTANIEEADYSTLVTADGKMLVQSRFAVRNNQRNFLKLSLPANAVLWSASVAGRPVRPGRAPDGSLLLPLEKTRSGDEAPAFVVEVSYLDQTPAWSDRGHIRISLLAVDLPISRSRLLLHHPPLFRLTPPPGIAGNFRIAPYEVPESGVLRSGSTSMATNSEITIQQDQASDATKELVSRLHDTKRASAPARNLPLRVAFPHFGPSVFMKSELTSESQIPIVELDFQRDKKRGER